MGQQKGAKFGKPITRMGAEYVSNLKKSDVSQVYPLDQSGICQDFDIHPSLCLCVTDQTTAKESEVKKDERPLPPVCLQWAYCIIIALSDLSFACSWFLRFFLSAL